MKKQRILPKSSSDPLSIIGNRKERKDVQSITEIDDQRFSLSVSQKKVLDVILVKRKSIFFTGAAGTGKSFLLRILQEAMDALNKSDRISFTAPTGVAACNIRGMTIHSWAGIGLATEPVQQLIGMVMNNHEAKKRWLETEILVIDEISMLSGELFDKLSEVGSRVRSDRRPFGGIQVVVCGDFFQLPPIGIGSGNQVHFTFESKAWKQLFVDNSNDGMIILKKGFRQQQSEFLQILNELRWGSVSEATERTLQQKVMESNRKLTLEANHSDDGKEEDSLKAKLKATKLFPTNNNVDSFNKQQLDRLGETPSSDVVHVYKAVDTGKENYLQQLRSGAKVPEKLELRIGAQVMLLKNIDTSRGLVNGARGTVIAFEDMSSSKSGRFSILPVVLFQILLGNQKVEETLLVKEQLWDVRSGIRTLASREQIPLMLAWAISIHKSQGMTIPFLEVSFEGMFEYGQGYVALSRATSLEGLLLRSFNRRSIRAHDKVKAFYKSMESLNGADELDAGDLTATNLKELVSSFVDGLPVPAAKEEGKWFEKKSSVYLDPDPQSTGRGPNSSGSIIITKQPTLHSNSHPVKLAPIFSSPRLNPTAGLKVKPPSIQYVTDEWLEGEVKVWIPPATVAKTSEGYHRSEVQKASMDWNNNNNTRNPFRREGNPQMVSQQQQPVMGSQTSDYTDLVMDKAISNPFIRSCENHHVTPNQSTEKVSFHGSNGSAPSVGKGKQQLTAEELRRIAQNHHEAMRRLEETNRRKREWSSPT